MKTQQLHLGLALLAASLAAQATLPTSGAYVSDPQSEYVQDQTSDGTSQASKILCYMANTRPDAMVNLGPYIAFIDEPQCATNKADASNSSSEGGGSSVNYTRMRLNSTRASNTSAQIVKGHASITMGQNNTPAYVYIYASGTEAPSASAPNGVVAMNMGALTVANQRVMRGKISATASGIQFSMNEAGAANYQLYVDGNETAGSGAIRYPDSQNVTQTITFGYNATAFCRNDGTNPTACFNRSKAEANSSVWRYGVYNDTTGARYDIDGPGFPVKNTTTGEYGFASYWGIWFPTAVTNGATLQSLASSPTNYTVVKTGGRLTKVTLVSSTLNEVAKVPFNFMPQTTTAVTGGNLTAYNTYEGYWDSSATNFAITSQLTCGQTGCFKTQVSYTATAAQMNTATTMNGSGFGLNGWSQGLGGNLMVPSSTLTATSPGTGVVKYNVQSVVMPGDTVPATLKCARDCPTKTLLQNIAANTSPYTANTKQKGGGTAAADVVSYTWSSANYTLSDSSGSLTNSLLTGRTLPPQNMGGIRTGALVDATGNKWTATGSMDCNGAQGTGQFFCDFKANGETTYYYWENGTNDYQSATFLKKTSDNSVVAFTPPQSATFDVPNDSTKYGTFAGAKLNLQFMGFGNMGGIPGRCFSPQTNQPADCGPTARYVPAFSIPENTANSQLGKLTINNATKWVKYLDREIRFKRVGVVGTNGFAIPNGITLGSAANLPAAMVLTGDADDPSVSSNSNYAGAVTANDFLAAPSVIHGVVQ